MIRAAFDGSLDVVTRSAILQRIAALSDDELARVGPYIEADLDALADLADLHAEVERGRVSAREEPLVDDEEVARLMQDRLGPRRFR